MAVSDVDDEDEELDEFEGDRDDSHDYYNKIMMSLELLTELMIILEPISPITSEVPSLNSIDSNLLSIFEFEFNKRKSSRKLLSVEQKPAQLSTRNAVSLLNGHYQTPAL